MPVVAYDPNSQTATDEKGRQFSIAAADVPPGLPTRAEWMTASDIQNQSTSTTPAPSPLATPAAPAPTAQDVLSKLDQVHAKLPPAARPGLPPIKSVDSTTSTQKGLSGAQMQPYLAASKGADEAAASAAEAKGAGDTQRAVDANRLRSNTADGLRSEASTRQTKSAADVAADQRQLELATAEKDPEIDPGRFLKSLGAGKSIALILLAGLTGAADAVLGRNGENGVVAVMNRRTDQDIEAQKQAIADGKASRGNRIQFWKDKGFDDRQAELAARVEVSTQAAKYAELQAELIGTPEALENGKALAAQIRAAGEVTRQAFVVANGTDRVSTGSSTHREAPAAAAGAGIEGFTKQLAARKAYEESGATPEQLAAFDTALGIPSPGGESETARGRREAGDKRTEDQGKAAGGLAGIDRFAKGAGLVSDPKTGEFSANAGDKSVFNKRQKERLASVGGLNPTASVELESLADAAIEGFGRVQSGGVISDDEAVRFKKMITSATTDAQLAERLNSIRAIVMPRVAKADRTGGAAPEGWR